MRVFAALLIVLFAFTADAAALRNYLETFDGFTPPEEPDETSSLPNGQFYDYTRIGTGTFTTTFNRALSSVSYRYNDTSTTSDDQVRFSFEDLGWSITNTNGSSFKFSFLVNEWPDVGQELTLLLGFDGGSLDAYCGLVVAHGGGTTIRTQSGTGTFATTAGPALNANTWYNLSISNARDTGTDASCDYYFPDQDLPFSLAAASDFDDGGFEMFHLGDIGDGGVGRHGAFLLDNITILNGPDPPPPTIPNFASISRTGVVGFDVDGSGTSVIIRYESGDKVDSLTPASLATLGTADTNCLTSDGVLAASDVVGFVGCVGGLPDDFNIRSFTLGDAGTALGCDSDDECLDDIPFAAPAGCGTGSFDDEDTLRNIKAIDTVGINYRLQMPGLGENNRAIAFAYSTSDGVVGVFEFTTASGCDRRNEERAVFAGESADDLCSFTRGGSQYIGAVAPASTTKIYQYVAQLVSSGGGTQELDGSLSTPVSYSALSNARAIGCAIDKLLVVTNGVTNNVMMFNITTGTLLWTATATNPDVRSAAISGNAEWAYYGDGSTEYLVHANNGTRIAAFTIPSGDVVGVRTDATSQNLWIATANGAAIYRVAGNVSQVPITCTALDCGLPTATATATGGILPSFGGPAAKTDNVVGQVVFAVNQAWNMDLTFFLGLLLYCALMIALGEKFPKLAGLIMFLALGICGVVVKLGLWPEYMFLLHVLAIVIVAGGVLFLQHRRRTGRGAA